MNLSPGTSLDRAVGALLGLATGDAVGTTLEFKPPGSFVPIDDLVGGGPFRLQPGQWTDDTSMALCLAESILDRDGLDPADQLRRYLLWKDEGYLSSTGTCFDIGNTTRAALERFRRTGATVDDPIVHDAAANGSLMRLAAVPVRYHADVEAAAEAGAESSRTTHGAARPVDACRVLAAMTAALIAGRSADDVLTPAFWNLGTLHPAVDDVARGLWQRRQPPEIRGTGYSVAALEAALWAVAGFHSCPWSSTGEEVVTYRHPNGGFVGQADHILLDKSTATKGLRTTFVPSDGGDLSDHQPLVVEISLDEPL
jgi:ADP-ribosyl-[dinitrogen reductase] hydrolase